MSKVSDLVCEVAYFLFLIAFRRLHRQQAIVELSYLLFQAVNVRPHAMVA